MQRQLSTVIYSIERVRDGRVIERFEASNLADLIKQIPIGRGYIMGFLTRTRERPVPLGTYRIDVPGTDDHWFSVTELPMSPGKKITRNH